jgi:hypothetical protein
LGADFTI